MAEHAPPSDAIQDMLAWAHRSRPRSLLIVCPETHPLLSAAAHTFTDTERTHLAPDRTTADRLGSAKFDLALVAGALESLPQQPARQMLAKLRDLNTRRFIILVHGPTSGDHAWRQTDMIAYGLKRCGRYEEQGEVFSLYRFNIHDYKETPDWLNARYWAHPERWGKARW